MEGRDTNFNLLLVSGLLPVVQDARRGREARRPKSKYTFYTVRVPRYAAFRVYETMLYALLVTCTREIQYVWEGCGFRVLRYLRASQGAGDLAGESVEYVGD